MRPICIACKVVLCQEQGSPKHSLSQAKKEHKLKLLGPDIFRWDGGLPREGVGANKFGMSLETKGNQIFGQDVRDFCRDIPEVPEMFETKKIVFYFWPHMVSSHIEHITKSDQARPLFRVAL